jgi:hypothetical protein
VQLTMYWPKTMLLFALTVLGCTSQPMQSSLKTAFGTLDAEFPQPGEWPFVGAIVVVWHPEDGSPLPMGAQCTGIRLPGQLILTNAHCHRPGLAQSQITLGWTNRYRAIKPDATQLRVNQSKSGYVFQGDLAQDIQDLPLLDLSEHPLYRRDGVLDYQIFEITSPSNDDSYVELAAHSSDVITDGASLLLSHPAGLPLLQSSKCRRFLKQEEYLHDCDSLKGSSGGALLSAEHGHLVGLHKQGYGSNDPAIFDKHGTFEESNQIVARECAALPQPQIEECQRTELATAYNKAVPISSILDDLQKNAPWLIERMGKSRLSRPLPIPR